MFLQTAQPPRVNALKQMLGRGTKLSLMGRFGYLWQTVGAASEFWRSWGHQ